MGQGVGIITTVVASASALMAKKAAAAVTPARFAARAGGGVGRLRPCLSWESVCGIERSLRQSEPAASLGLAARPA